MLTAHLVIFLHTLNQIQSKPADVGSVPSATTPLYEPFHEFVLLPPNRGSVLPPLAFSTGSLPDIACVRKIAEENRTEILIRDIASPSLQRVLTTTPHEVVNLDWSPDNRYLAVISKPKEPHLQIVEVQSGATRDLGRIGTAWIRWGADSKSLYYWSPHYNPATEPPLWRLTRLSPLWDKPATTPLSYFYPAPPLPSEPSNGTLSPNAKIFVHWRLEKNRDGSGDLNLILEEIETGKQTLVHWRKFEEVSDFSPYRIEFDWSPDQQWLYIVYQRGDQSRPFHYVLDYKGKVITALNPALLAYLDTGRRVFLPIRRWIQARGTQLLFLPSDIDIGEFLHKTKESGAPLYWGLYNPTAQTISPVLGCPERVSGIVTSSTGKYLIQHDTKNSPLRLYKMSLRYLISPQRTTPSPKPKGS